MFEWLKKDSKETDKKLLLEAWKEVVNVQMHFNDMEMKIRSLAVTVITAISGAIGYLLKDSSSKRIYRIIVICRSRSLAMFLFNGQIYVS